MPKVGKKEFSYSKAGKQAAKDFAKESGQEVSYFGGGILDARNRSQNLDFGTMYKEGDTIYERNQAKREKVKNKKYAAKKAAEAEDRDKYDPGKEGDTQQKIDKLAAKRAERAKPYKVHPISGHRTKV